MKTICLLHFAMLLTVRIAWAGTVHIQGTVSNTGGEVLQCTVVSNALHVGNMVVVLPLNDGRFYHRFELSEPTFLSFSDGINYFGGLVEPGDSISIEYDRLRFGDSFSYGGAGKEKFEIAYSIDQIKGFSKKILPAAQVQRYPVDYMFSAIDSLKAGVEGRIALAAGSMSAESRIQLLGYLSASELLARYSSLVRIFGEPYTYILNTHRDKLSAASVDRMQKLLMFDSTYNKSKLYADAVKSIASIYLEENIQPKTADFVTQKYRLLAGMLPETLRSPVIYLVLKSDISNPSTDVNEPAVLDAISLLTDAPLKHSITGMLAEKKQFRVGDKAPEFSVRNLTGEQVSLASFQGKTVYLDFWFASCGPCHVLFKSIESVKKQFEHDERVVFLMVSIDNENTWKKAVSKFGVKGYHVFTGNKLRDHPIIKSYGVAAYPTTYIIDPTGKFHSVRPSQNPDVLTKQIEESLDGARSK